MNYDDKHMSCNIILSYTDNATITGRTSTGITCTPIFYFLFVKHIPPREVSLLHNIFSMIQV